MLDMVCELHPELCKIFDDAGIPISNMETLNAFFGEYNMTCNSIIDGSTIKPGPYPSTIDVYPTPTKFKPGPVPSTMDDYPTISEAGQSSFHEKILSSFYMHINFYHLSDK